MVQGAQYSGSLITSRLAMEFGREVFGVPGNVTEGASFAPNQLIKQGAKLVTGWEDVVEELPTEIRAELFPVDATTAEERASLFEQALSPAEKKLYRADSASKKPIHVDELVERTGLSSSETLASLCEMEMRGIIRQMPGKQFVRGFTVRLAERTHGVPSGARFGLQGSHGEITGHRRIAREGEDDQQVSGPRITRSRRPSAT